MIIKRHFGEPIGEVEIELTDDELLKAFYEMRDEFDKQDIEDYFEPMSDEECMEAHGITLEEAKSLYSDMAKSLRRNIDNDDSWFYARYEAIKCAINHFIRGRK